jgi:hypothetical protein
MKALFWSTVLSAVLYAAIIGVLSIPRVRLQPPDPSPPPIDHSFSLDLPQPKDLTIETVEIRGSRIPRSTKLAPAPRFFDFSRSSCRSIEGVRGSVQVCEKQR